MTVTLSTTGLLVMAGSVVGILTAMSRNTIARVNVVDTVAYKNLIPGRTYVVEGTLYNAETGEVYKDADGKTYTSSTEFKAVEADGTVDVIFENVLVSYEKTKAVVFEDLTDKETGVKITTHSDISDETQTVERPTAVTTATVEGNKEIWLASLAIDSDIKSKGMVNGLSAFPHVHSHMLRHTFATRMREAGADIKATADIMGHTEVELTLNTYTDATDEFKKKEIALIDLRGKNQAV